jgi:hypothetical protein
VGADLRGRRGAFSSAAGLRVIYNTTWLLIIPAPVPDTRGRPRLAFAFEAGLVGSNPVSYEPGGTGPTRRGDQRGCIAAVHRRRFHRRHGSGGHAGQVRHTHGPDDRRPDRPAPRRHRHGRHRAQVAYPSRSFTLCVCAASNIARASLASSASGFSHSTCLPASAARIVHSACMEFGNGT